MGNFDIQNPVNTQGAGQPVIVQDMSQLLDRILSDTHLPDKIKNSYQNWILSSTNLLLCNLNDENIRRIRSMWRKYKIQIKRHLEGHDFDLNTAIAMNAWSIEFEAILARAKGGFERENQVKQIYSQITNPGAQDNVHKMGYLRSFTKNVLGWD